MCLIYLCLVNLHRTDVTKSNLVTIEITGCLEYTWNICTFDLPPQYFLLCFYFRNFKHFLSCSSIFYKLKRLLISFEIFNFYLSALFCHVECISVVQLVLLTKIFSSTHFYFLCFLSLWVFCNG